MDFNDPRHFQEEPELWEGRREWQSKSKLLSRLLRHDLRYKDRDNREHTIVMEHGGWVLIHYVLHYLDVTMRFLVELSSE